MNVSIETDFREVKDIVLAIRSLSEQLSIKTDAIQETKELINAIQSLPIEHDEKGHAFKRIPCRSMNDLGAWVAHVNMRLSANADSQREDA